MELEKIKVIFLDVDNVLNCSTTSSTTSESKVRFVDDFLVERLATIVEKTGAVIVLSSTWREDVREGTQDGIDLINILGKYGLYIHDLTAPRIKDKYIPRGVEIQKYLDEHHEVESFVILDDYDDMEMLIDRLVCVEDGLTEYDVEEAIRLLSTPRGDVTVWDVVKSMRLTEYDYPYKVMIRSKEGELLDYCKWTGSDLICENDKWKLTDKIYKYERIPFITVWVESNK